MVLIVVVLPAPFRPSRATISPEATEMFSPDTTALPRYPTTSPRVSIIGQSLDRYRAGDPRFPGGAEVGLYDSGVATNLGRRSLSDDSPGVKGQHPVAEFEDKLDVVFDDYDAHPLAQSQLLQQLLQLPAAPGVASGRGLVQNQDSRLLSERVGVTECRSPVLGFRSPAVTCYRYFPSFPTDTCLPILSYRYLPTDRHWPGTTGPP